MKTYFSSFVGIPLPADIKTKFGALLDEIKPLSRFFDMTDRRSPHITINFFGEKDLSDLQEYNEILSRNVDLFSGIELKFGGLDCFTPENPRVVFTNIEMPKKFIEAQETLGQKFKLREEKEFHPHLTLMRLRSDVAQEEFEKNKEEIEKIVKNIDWSFQVDNVAIFGVDKDWTRDGQQIIFKHKI